jgi:FSR family fosmidomycin resistance protein-like MFS transporter
LIAIVHIVMDVYPAALPVLISFLVTDLGLSLAQAGFLNTAFISAASFSQPLFGYWSDRYTRSGLLATGVAWTALFVGLTGTGASYPIILVLLVVGSLGIAVFHPLGAALVASWGGQRKGTATSIFYLGGNLGFALGPILMAAALGQSGRIGTLWLIVPGVTAGFLLWKKMRVSSSPPVGPGASLEKAVWSTAGLGLAILIILFGLRSWIHSAVSTFLPIYLLSRGFSLDLASAWLAAFMIAGALGGLAGGYFSDLFGRKSIICGSLLAFIPCFWLFMNVESLVSLLFLGLAGFMVVASHAVVVVMAQELLPDNTGMASGAIVGLAAGLGSWGVALSGMIADRFGLPASLNLLMPLTLLAVLFGLLVPRPRGIPPQF